MDFNYKLIGLAFILNGLVAGCAPSTPAEKAQDKVEDAAHETKQGVNRAVDKVKDATN